MVMLSLKYVGKIKDPPIWVPMRGKSTTINQGITPPMAPQGHSFQQGSHTLATGQGKELEKKKKEEKSL